MIEDWKKNYGVNPIAFMSALADLSNEHLVYNCLNLKQSILILRSADSSFKDWKYNHLGNIMLFLFFLLLISKAICYGSRVNVAASKTKKTLINHNHFNFFQPSIQSWVMTIRVLTFSKKII